MSVTIHIKDSSVGKYFVDGSAQTGSYTGMSLKINRPSLWTKKGDYDFPIAIYKNGRNQCETYINSSGSNFYDDATEYTLDDNYTYYVAGSKSYPVINYNAGSITPTVFPTSPTNVKWPNGLTCQTYVDSTEPEATGYTFSRYTYTSSEGTVDYYPGDLIYVTANVPITLKAIWTANTYTVALDANGGTAGSTIQVTATYNADMPPITGEGSLPTRTGYTFKGYYDAKSGGTLYYNSDGTSAHAWDKTTSTKLYAQWSAKLLYVHYYQKEDDEALDLGKDYFNYGEDILLRSNAGSMEGHTFDKEWYQKSPYKVYKAGSTLSFTSNKTLYGIWTPIPCKVTYKTSKGSAPKAETWSWGVLKATPSADSCGIITGYNLATWDSDTVSVTPGTNTSVKADTIFTANWLAKKYTVYLNPGNDYISAGTTQVETEYNEDMPNITIPERLGYIFSGYKSSTGVLYYDEFGFSARKWNIDIDKNTLEAVWTPITYTYKLIVATRYTQSEIKAFEVINKEAALTSVTFNIKNEIVPKLKRASCTLLTIIDINGAATTTYVVSSLTGTEEITINAKDNLLELIKTIKSTWRVDFPLFHWSNYFDSTTGEYKAGDDTTDNELFASKLSSSLTADMWNIFNYQIQLLAGGESAYLYTAVKSSDAITAERYNHAAAKLKELDEETSTPSEKPFKYHVNKGEKILLSYLNNGTSSLLSLKEEANKVYTELYGSN